MPVIKPRLNQLTVPLLLTINLVFRRFSWPADTSPKTLYRKKVKSKIFDLKT